MNRSTPPSTGAPVHKGLISALAFAGALLCLQSTATAEDAATSMPPLVMDCCTTASYRHGDTRSLNLTSPLNLTIVSYVKGFDPAHRQSLITDFDKIASLAKFDFDLDPSPYSSTPYESGLMVVVLPALRSDLSESDLKNLHDRFEVLPEATSATGPKNIDAVLNEIYKMYVSSGMSYRFFSGSAKINTAIIFVRPENNLNLDVVTVRAVLQGFGYNADGKPLDGSIFAEHEKGMTEGDEGALRWLYKR